MLGNAWVLTLICYCKKEEKDGYNDLRQKSEWVEAEDGEEEWNL